LGRRIHGSGAKRDVGPSRPSSETLDM
jgi:hypothetical protein